MGVSFKKLLNLILIIGYFHGLPSKAFPDEIEYNDLIILGKQLESSISSGNPYYFNLCFNTESIIDSAILSNPKNAENSFAQGFIEGLKQQFDPGNAILELIGADGSFTFIRAYKRDGRSKLLFRLISSNGINYHEYDVGQKDEKLVLTDAYIFTTAQTISGTYKNIYNKYFLNLPEYRISRADKKIQRLAAIGNSRKAYKQWLNLPENIRFSKTNQLMGIHLASKLDRETYFGAYIEFMNHFPDEPGKYFIALEGLIKQGYYHAALKAIEKLDEYIQTDPILNVIKADIYYESGDTQNAEEHLNKLIEEMPEYETGYLNLLGLYIEENEFMKATLLLDKIILTFNASKEDLQQIVTDYTDFLQSDEFKNWMNN